MNDKIRGPYAPQQQVIAPGMPGQRPPKGWVPPLSAVLNLIGVYDTESGYWVGLPIEALTEALLVAESLHTEDRIDERNKIELTVPSGTDVDVVKTKEYEIPAGEVWYINRFGLTTPLEVLGNVRISKFPKVDTTEKAYLADNQAVNSSVNYDLGAAGQLGADLRLVGGDKIIVVGKVNPTAATTADRVVTLNLYGRKARRLV